MKLKTFHSPRLLATLSLALPVTAQGTPGTPIPPQRAQGLFTNLAVGMTVEETPEVSYLWIRAPGANSGVPLEWNSATFGIATAAHPDFSIAQLTRWAPPAVPRGNPFGGISTGGDIMPTVDASGRMVMSPGLWCMVSVVLDSAALGMPGSLLKSRVSLGINPATEIMSYYAEGSSGIHPRFLDTVRIEYTDAQLYLQQAAPQASQAREIVNHDFAMGVNASNSTGAPDPMFPVRDQFYFTLTQPFVTSLTALNVSLGGHEPCASHVYRLQWNGMTLEWDGPTIAFHHDDLFPNRQMGTVEIDALSVFAPSSGPSRVVFSLTPESDDTQQPFDQLLVYQTGPSQAPICNTTALKAPGGMPITQKMGLKPRTPTGTPDNVKSACIGDPHDLSATSRRMGIATDGLRQGKGDFGFTAVRHSQPNSALDELHVQFNGFDLENHMLGFIQLQLEGPVNTNSAPVPILPWIQIDPVSLTRNALDLPPLPVTRTSTSALRFSALLWGVNPDDLGGVNLLRESWVLTVFL
ncbi:MAG: hypothetical protein FJ294_03455 [Planctomycetes bacterium]|nr:hypothetical protein [Planctomycetota bacterium]